MGHEVIGMGKEEKEGIEGTFNPDCAVDTCCGFKSLAATLVSRF